MTITGLTTNNGDTSTSSIVLTFTSSEATTNFALGDITVTGGTLSDFDSQVLVFTAQHLLQLAMA